MSDTSRSPTLSEVIRQAVNDALIEVHTSMPCRVESYDASKQCVNLQPLIKQAFLDEESTRVAARLPVLVNVPVQFPGSGNFRITFPLAVGSEGMAIFSESSLDTWLDQGGEVDPNDDRRFHLSDAFFLPGIRSFKNALQDAPTDRMTIGVDGGAQIHISESGINIGSNSGAELAPVALGDGVDGYLGSLGPTSLRTWLTALASFVAFLTPIPPATGLSSASVKVKK